MTPPGFNVEVGVDEGTGFVYGGSVHNCGTWMDKVGESTWAGNKGAPATPRNGSAVELVGLSYSAIQWLHQLSQLGQFPYSRVNLPSDDPHSRRTLDILQMGVTHQRKLRAPFLGPVDRNLASQKEGTQASYLHRTGMYKDCVGSTQRYANYQLRPNFPSRWSSPGAVLAGECLDGTADGRGVVLGPLGMRTLDPRVEMGGEERRVYYTIVVTIRAVEDYVYNGYYINSVDSGNYNTAKVSTTTKAPSGCGWWDTSSAHGSSLPTEMESKSRDNLSLIHSVLSTHAQALQDSPWKDSPNSP
ncbi:Glycogen debranching enzyme, partial [Geodia barretti]